MKLCHSPKLAYPLVNPAPGRAYAIVHRVGHGAGGSVVIAQDWSPHHMVAPLNGASTEYRKYRKCSSLICCASASSGAPYRTNNSSPPSIQHLVTACTNEIIRSSFHFQILFRGMKTGTKGLSLNVKPTRSQRWQNLCRKMHHTEASDGRVRKEVGYRDMGPFKCYVMLFFLENWHPPTS